MVLPFSIDENTVSDVTEAAVRALIEAHENEKLIAEYRLLIEELSCKLVAAAPPGSVLTLEISEKKRNFRIRFLCSGSPVSLTQEKEDDIGGILLDEYADHLHQTYFAGTNRVTFSAQISSSRFLLSCLISLVAALVCFSIGHHFLPPIVLDWFDLNLTYPLSTMFTDAMNLLAMPVAFFSLTASLISLYMSWDKNHRLTRMIVRYFFSSLVAVVIGYLTALLLRGGFAGADISEYSQTRASLLGSSLGSFLEQAVVGNIIDVFTSTSPLPMLLLAAVMASASIRLFGREGDHVRESVLGLKSIFCQMLNLVYMLAPVFLFFSVMTSLYTFGLAFVARILRFFVLFLVPCIILVLGYIVRLSFAGISPLEFQREYGEVVRENHRIGSNIEAFPYNRRQLRRVTGLPRPYLNEVLRLGTIMNMDGGTLITAFAITIYISLCRIQLPWEQQMALFLILLLVSIGAPNQPGSFLLISAVLFRYVGISSVLLSDILLVEVFYGKLYSFFNALGDIVSVAISRNRYYKEK